ncbi:MAG: NAD-dependent epimerase/dehydratase family protein [Prevotella sp.]
MNILIVGGTGVISYAVVIESIKQGHHVTCINRGKSTSQKLPETVELIKADYRKQHVIEGKLQDRHFDVAIDFLCITEKNIEYSVNLFKDKCDQYIFISSCAVYNLGSSADYKYSEDSPKVSPLWDYSINKVASEKKLTELAAKYNLKYTIARPCVTYGNTRIPYGITPPYGYHGTLIQRLLHGKPIILWDNGEAFCNFTRVEDFAVGFVGLFGNQKAYNEAFNIVGDVCETWLEVIKTTADLLGVEPKFVNITSEQFAYEVSTRKGEILAGRAPKQIMLNHKLKSVVPTFDTKFSLREGIALTIDYYKKNNYLYGIDYKFDGDWDRIAAKYAPSYEPKFVDYLGDATEKDMQDYYDSLHKSIRLEHIKIPLRKNYYRLRRLAKRIFITIGLIKQ